MYMQTHHIYMLSGVSLSIHLGCNVVPSMSLVNVGICKNGLNLVTSYTICKCIGIPRALYGCEIWPILNNKLKSKLEISHRLTLKLKNNIVRNKINKHEISRVSLRRKYTYHYHTPKYRVYLHGH